MKNDFNIKTCIDHREKMDKSMQIIDGFNETIFSLEKKNV